MYVHYFFLQTVFSIQVLTFCFCYPAPISFFPRLRVWRLYELILEFNAQVSSTSSTDWITRPGLNTNCWSAPPTACPEPIQKCPSVSMWRTPTIHRPNSATTSTTSRCLKPRLPAPSSWRSAPTISIPVLYSIWNLSIYFIIIIIMVIIWLVLARPDI